MANTDAATLGQVKNIAAAAAQAEIASAGVSTSMINDMQRELSDLRALVRQQQQEITELKAGRTTAALD